MSTKRLLRATSLLAAGILLVGCVGADPDGNSARDEPPLEHLTHVHGLAVPWWDSDQLLVATHRGLVRHTAATGWETVSEEPHDLMGFAAGHQRDVLYGSGHPSLTSGLANPLGLVVSEDGGVTWAVRSLGGEVDFHRLVVAHDDGTMLGVDAAQGRLLTRVDDGVSWVEFPVPAEGPTTDVAVGADGTPVAVATADALLVNDGNRPPFGSDHVRDGRRELSYSEQCRLLVGTWLHVVDRGLESDRQPRRTQPLTGEWARDAVHLERSGAVRSEQLVQRPLLTFDVGRKGVGDRRVVVTDPFLARDIIDPVVDAHVDEITRNHRIAEVVLDPQVGHPDTKVDCDSLKRLAPGHLSHTWRVRDACERIRNRRGGWRGGGGGVCSQGIEGACSQVR